MKDLKSRIDKIIPGMIKLRRQIHQNPEPAYEEFETAAAIVQQLEKIEGMEIRTGVGTTGVVALLGGEKKGPCIALRADMDCLRMEEQNRFSHASQNKGLMHGCGHDGHIACLAGAALALGEIVEKLPGPVKFIFQPGEENGAGARAMIKDGALEDPVPRAIFGLHGTPSLPLGKIGLRNGPMMAASRYFSIRIRGRGTHAAMPHKGTDTVLAASQIICAAHTIVSRNINPLQAALISIPTFEASRAPNVLPEEVNLQGTLRALSHETRAFLEKRLREVVDGTARAHGAEGTIKFYGGYPLLENDRQCCEYVAATAEQVMDRNNIRSDYPPSLGAEDFSFYLEHVPGAFWWLGLGIRGEEDIPLHNPRFDFNDDVIHSAITLHYLLAINSHLLKVSP